MEERFDPGKEIIVYCASRDCDASTRVARELTNRGYHRIVDFEAGMSAWKAAEQPVTGNGA
jgi:rhodanese-related sulfurtransferase